MIKQPRRLAMTTLMVTLAACNSDPTGPAYVPNLPPSWAVAVTNNFFPLLPGTTWEFSGQTADGLETILVEVLAETRMVNGVRATVVRDRVYLKGSLIEDTYDWYAQAADGNVWYLGEDSKEIENGRVINTNGSWEWGKDSALPGIMMWADPAAHIGEEYRQEYYKGKAEDFAKVVAVNQTVTTAFGTRTGCIQTEDRNGLERNSTEQKYYCPGIGLMLEVQGSERVGLTKVTRR